MRRTRGRVGRLGRPTLAQKSMDTLRVAANDSYAMLSPYDLAINEASPIYKEIYSPLLEFNEHEKRRKDSRYLFSSKLRFR